MSDVQPDRDQLAQTIRSVDGPHSLGAAALADAIIDSGFFAAHDARVRSAALQEADSDGIVGYLTRLAVPADLPDMET